MATQEVVDEAISLWGKATVYEAMEVAEMSDADGAWSMFNDMGKFCHAKAIEFIYFDTY